ncbi:hypothetical protein NE237_009768 [Protea cynaroides]|uniref:Uncharacterized protein n=1 Tax=Protea cynaroides TaxID=273540 RepID=A0A9Q0JSH3_9MAGN|nr:hypothetical protein NE237_026740 [Protea cynaroides]KAJ4978988.1 hypothetical protein NE237_009768 [Protea cynaroides]
MSLCVESPARTLERTMSRFHTLITPYFFTRRSSLSFSLSSAPLSTPDDCPTLVFTSALPSPFPSYPCPGTIRWFLSLWTSNTGRYFGHVPTPRADDLGLPG